MDHQCPFPELPASSPLRSATKSSGAIPNDDDDTIPLITCSDELLRLGIVSHVPISIPGVLDMDTWRRWAHELSQVTPAIITSEGDGEYAFYRNILDEPDFPFSAILNDGNTAIGQAIRSYFHVDSLETDIRLDDAFCIHYHTSQTDTRGAKHMDPSDITINLCLEKSGDCQGSDVAFYGTKALQGVAVASDGTASERPSDFRFRVNQEPGYATLHWGNHPHETTRLEKGQRTNIVITYCYTDKSRSDVATRSCYNV